MSELQAEKQGMGLTDGFANQGVATRTVEEMPIVGDESKLIDTDQIETREVRGSVQLLWNRDQTAGDCRIMDRKATFFPDGTARFQARVRSSDSDDCWVYFGGIAINDINGTELWRSGKLIGPSMPEENVDFIWDQRFSYPAIWFGFIARATLFGANC
ncbi:DUF6294 family protein [Nonomuraea sp. B19D2]|uniref:DUF6294 family protein n=1 Tax=Nonomuraea sp. B19D2 TaxID=3159561 RepID=UPI0032DA21F4